MTRIYRYKLTTDNGMAPCIDAGLVSLATCKPNVRAGAKPGDWVVGFRSVANSDPLGVVIWAGQVAHSMEVGEYERHHRGRSDAVYRAIPEGGFKRLRPDYHSSERQFCKDTFNPALIFDRDATWYFGREPHVLPKHLVHLAPKVRERDFLVNGVKDGDVTELKEWLWGIAPNGIHGKPRNGTPPPHRSARPCERADRCCRL